MGTLIREAEETRWLHVEFWWLQLPCWVAVQPCSCLGAPAATAPHWKSASVLGGGQSSSPSARALRDWTTTTITSSSSVVKVTPILSSPLVVVSMIPFTPIL